MHNQPLFISVQYQHLCKYCLTMSIPTKFTLDPVSFLFGQVLSQVDYLFESGYLTQDHYSTIAGALLQSSPPTTPAAAPASTSTYGSTHVYMAEPVMYPAASSSNISNGPPPPRQSSNVSSSTGLQQQSPKTSQPSSRPSILKFKSKSSKGKSTRNETSLPQVPFAGADEPQLGKVNSGIRGALQGGYGGSSITKSFNC